MGLVLNTGKCELTAHRDCVVDDQLLQSFIRVDIGDASLLGAPLFTGRVLDNAWLKPNSITLAGLKLVRSWFELKFGLSSSLLAAK